MKRSTTRRAFLGVAIVSGLSTAFACATSDDPTGQSGPSPDEEGGVLVLDGAPPDVPDAYVDGTTPTCSDAGWCKTPLPDSRLELKDIWPLENRAFATSSSDNLGTKVLEWDGATWSFIDDGTQNDIVGFAPSVWAPSENEVFFSMIDGSMINGLPTAGQFVFHGVRTAPGMPFVWTRDEVLCDHFTSASPVWGSSATDLYTSTCETIFHHPGGDAGATDAGDSGAPGWVAELPNDDPTNPVAYSFVSGTGPDDVWFAGSRSNCLVLTHKTASRYRTIIDGNLDIDGNCVRKTGFTTIVGGPVGFTTPAPGVAVVTVLYFPVDGTPNLNFTVRVDTLADGGAEVIQSQPPPSFTLQIGPVWGTNPDDLWMLVNASAVVKAESLWNDAGSYNYSTMVINGAPNFERLDAVRGTSNSNLWLVGVNSAFHKTTP